MAKTVGKAPEGFKKKMSEQGWTERGGIVLGWELGMEVVGTYRGVTPPSNEDSSPVMRIETEVGVVARYWAPTILASKLADIEEGTDIYIVCLGKTAPIKSRKGTLAWNFDVYTK